jgi:hypothetical protein
MEDAVNRLARENGQRRGEHLKGIGQFEENQSMANIKSMNPFKFSKHFSKYQTNMNSIQI